MPSSPSSVSSTSSASKRSKHKQLSPFELHQSSDDDDDSDICSTPLRKKKNKYFGSANEREKRRNSEKDRVTWDAFPFDTKDSSINLKDPMMSTSHSPLHFSNDLNNYMDHMFFSSSLSADDSIDLCTILKTEYDGEIMIG